jgi:hypothetical protein
LLLDLNKGKRVLITTDLNSKKGIMIMKAIERKGRILPNGNIQLNEPIDAPSGEVRLLILFPEDLRQEIPQKLSPEEKKRIVTVLDGVAELSLREGPPVSNREHDQYLYGGGN